MKGSSMGNMKIFDLCVCLTIGVYIFQLEIFNHKPGCFWAKEDIYFII